MSQYIWEDYVFRTLSFQLVAVIVPHNWAKGFSETQWSHDEEANQNHCNSVLARQLQQHGRRWLTKFATEFTKQWREVCSNIALASEKVVF